METQTKIVVKTEPRTHSQIDDNEIRVTAQGRIRNYIAYAISLFQEKQGTVVLKGMGRVINKTVSLAEILRRQVDGVYVCTEIGSVKVCDSESPTKETTRLLSAIKIVLTKDPLPGRHYEPPFDEHHEEVVITSTRIAPKTKQGQKMNAEGQNGNVAATTKTRRPRQRSRRGKSTQSTQETKSATE